MDYPQAVDGNKQPYYIRLKSGEPFGIGGLWDRWDKQGEPPEAGTILSPFTTSILVFFVHLWSQAAERHVAASTQNRVLAALLCRRTSAAANGTRAEVSVVGDRLGLAMDIPGGTGLL
jgi:hypothetical protein